MSDTPFRIAILGAFGAGASRPPLAERRVRRVDRDDLDAAFAAVAPVVEITLAGRDDVVPVAPRALDDLHPDRLVESVDALREVRAARERVATRSSFQETVARIRSEADARPAASHADGAETLSILERIVDAASLDDGSSAKRAGDSELEDLIGRIVSPHVVHEPDARQQAWVDEMDRALREALAAVVRHPSVQALERAWRTVDFLARRLDTGESLQLHLVDVDRAELADDLAAHAADPVRAAVARQLARVAEGGWSLLLVLHDVGAGDEDARLAAGLAALGRAVGAPVVAGARPSLAGATTFAGDIDGEEWRDDASEAWSALRRSADARWLGLVAPRVLLRMPYGAEGEPCEVVPLEEVGDEQEAGSHERYCWGSGAACAALLLGEAASEDASRPAHDVTGLPLHVRRVAGAAELLSCAEGVMYERGALALLARGLMPLAWMRGDDAVKLVRFQSVAEGGHPLAAPRPVT